MQSDIETLCCRTELQFVQLLSPEMSVIESRNDIDMSRERCNTQAGARANMSMLLCQLRLTQWFELVVNSIML